MAGELWDLSGPQERVAAAMWRSEAERVGMNSVAAKRTPDAFRDEAEDVRQKWLELAAVAIEALIAADQEGDG